MLMDTGTVWNHVSRRFDLRKSHPRNDTEGIDTEKKHRPIPGIPTPNQPEETIQMKKVGIIRCQQTEDMCPGTTDFRIASQGALAFEETGPVEIVGFVSCGGCPGKRAIARAKLMVDRGAEAIVFTSCISKGNPIGYPCPHYANMRDAIIKKIGPDVKIIEYTH